jgi:Na+:H+ antiporter, NhaA family
MLVATLERLFRHEAASGIVLMLASALALVLANSPLAGFYDLLLSLHGSVRIGSFGIEKPLLLWVNDGLMAIFFLLVGLEIKREVLAGQLSDRSGAILPAAAAIGGMVVPPSPGTLPAPHPAGRSRRRPILHSRSALWRCSAAGCRQRSSSS